MLLFLTVFPELSDTTSTTNVVYTEVLSGMIDP